MSPKSTSFLQWKVKLTYYTELYNEESHIAQILVSRSDVFNDILSSVDFRISLEIY